jgi:hypothetical protein
MVMVMVTLGYLSVWYLGFRLHKANNNNTCITFRLR